MCAPSRARFALKTLSTVAVAWFCLTGSVVADDTITQVAKLLDTSDGDGLDYFGMSVSVDGNTAVAGGEYRIVSSSPPRANLRRRPEPSS